MKKDFYEIGNLSYRILMLFLTYSEETEHLITFSSKNRVGVREHILGSKLIDENLTVVISCKILNI